jgi:sugar lactone lactonase YvrE
LVVALGIASLAGVPVNLLAQSISYAGMQSVLSVTGLEAPLGVAVDGAGNRYIANNGSTNITEISPSGTQTTIPSTLLFPGEIASDVSGNLYVADTGNSRVLRIAAGGGAQTTVGTGWISPWGVAVDSLGNVYVTDLGQALAIEVATGGAQTPIAQSYLSFPYAVAVDSYNNVYITDFADNSLVEVTAAGVASYRINNVLNQSPTGVAVDKFGNIFVSSSTEGPGYLELYGADGSVRQLGSFVAPYGLATDALGNVYVADPGANLVDVLAPGAVDMGQANLCPASSPQPCTQSATLNFNVQALSENLSDVVVKVATQGGENLDFTATSDTCTGSFTTLTTCAIGIQFKPLAPGIRLGAVDVVGVVASNGDDLRSNGHSNAVMRKAHHNSHSQNSHPDFVFPDGATELATVYLHGIGSGPLAGFDAGLINTLPINLAQTPYISGVTADTNGDLFVVDEAHCVVSEYVAATGLTSVVAGSGTCGESAGDGGLATAATFQDIWRVAVNARGDLFIPDYSTCVIRKVDGLTGIINTIAGTANARGYTADGVLAIDATLSFPLDIAFDDAGNLFYLDYQEALVRRIDVSSGILTTVAGNFASGPGFSGDGGPATSAQLSLPIGLVIDNASNIYIADLANNVIRKVTASTGIITTAAGQGPPVAPGYGGDGGLATSALLFDPEGVAVDAAGNIYVADTINFLIRKVDASTGIITTAAGVYDGGGNNQNGNQRYTGDGGAANLAGLSDVRDVAVDSSGNIYIADTDNDVVRNVTVASGIATFGSFPENSSSPAINVALTNNGNASLDLSDLLASSNFNLGGSETSCGGSSQLPPGDSCELGIEFHPLAVGSLNGTITVTDNVGK